MGLLQNKTAIITGASNPRGMGKATAVKMALEGASVVVTDLAAHDKNTALLKVVDEIQTNGGNAIGMAVDVTNEKEIQNCVKRSLERFGKIDILFNNAGSPAGVGPFLDIDTTRWDQTFQVNLFGQVRFCRAVIPHMMACGGGAIINNASTAGLGGLPEFSAYGASKFAVVGLTKCLAAEYGTHNIRVNCVCPGMIDTVMSDIEIAHYAEMQKISHEEARNELSKNVPLNRYGYSEEVAQAVIYLASERSSYTTGVALPVAGGLAPGL